MKNKVFLYILCVILMLAGIGMFASSISEHSAELVSIASLSCTDIDGSDDYEMTEAIVLDNYATYEENNIPKTHYLAVGFYDLNDTLCMGSLAMDKGDDIYEAVMDYLNDNTKFIGDLVLPMYCSASKLSENGDIGKYFGEYAQELSTTGLYAQPVWIQMDYQGATPAEYTDSLASDSIGSAIMGGAFLVLGILLLVLTKRADKKATAAKASPAPVYAAPPAPAAPATPGTCPTCGEKVKPTETFCGNCGTKLK